ncbi:MAG: PAS domain-containing protein [Vitreimonas sp.]
MPCAVIVSGRDRKVRAYNARTVELFGRPLRPGEDDCERFLFSADLEPAIMPLKAPLLSSVLATGEAIHGREVVIERPDGTRIVAIASLTALRGDAGEIDGVCATFEEAGALRHALEAVRQREARLLELLNALPAALYTTDAEGRVTFFNEAARDLTGRDPQLGKDQWCISSSLTT